VTTLRPGEIAVGKLLAGWAVGLVALGLTIPFAGWAMVEGGVGVVRVLAVYGVSALLMGVVCAISLAFSATIARTVTSTLLSYLTVGVLCIGTLIGFELLLPLTETQVAVQTPEGYTYTYPHTHTEYIWWVVAPNPFAILADSAPRVDPRVTIRGDVVQLADNDPLSALARGVRSLRRPNSNSAADLQDDAYAVWPWGLGFDVLVGVGAMVVTTRRLRTPSRRLGRGIRVA
jgi:hypothetical protein